MATTEAMRAIPFTVTTERAAKIFNDWRLSLWYHHQPPLRWFDPMVMLTIADRPHGAG
jgi:hypothetical protein